MTEADDPRPPGRRWLRLALGLLGLPPLAAAALAGWLWVTTDLPVGAAPPPQLSTIRFADGSELTSIGRENRTSVRLDQVSPAARHAVLAAEDRGFYEDRGISPRGIARAALANLRSGEIEQGGSTITQQYVRAAYLTPERTWSRKAREVVLALKVERALGKDAVLESYLDTVYFGRGAHGIEAAGQTYFGKPAAELTAPEGAVLAALLRSPTAYDPAADPERARDRWLYVLRGMAERGWLDGPVETQQYPEVLPRQSPGHRLGGPGGYLAQQVVEELRRRGFRDESIEGGGLLVETTLDPRAQDAAVRAVQETVGAELPDGVYAGLVAVEPCTGRIRAAYGGADYVRRPYNAVTQGAAQAGSSFKPYVLAAALERGIPLSTVFDGSSPQVFDGGYRVRNFAGASYGDVDLLTATATSINTVYVSLGLRVGPRQVARTAEELGITADMSRERESAAISLGVTTVTPLEQANAFATFACGGLRARPFVVERVRDRLSGTVYYEAEQQVERVLDEAVASEVTRALRAVTTSGSGRNARVPGRPVAGKTGTTSRNTAAWFVGYTPQLATAVAVYSERADAPLRGFAGVREVTGGSLPARASSRFTAAALEGEPVQQFPESTAPAPPAVSPSPPPPSVEPLPSREDPGPRPVPMPQPGDPLDLRASG